MKRYESVVKKILKWYSNPDNFKKPLKTAAYELGYSYDYVKQCISKYGADRFRREREKIYEDLLSESANIAIARLHDMLLSEDPEKFSRAQAEIRAWFKVIFGEKAKIKHNHSGDIQIRILHELINDRPTAYVVSEDKENT